MDQEEDFESFKIWKSWFEEEEEKKKVFESLYFYLLYTIHNYIEYKSTSNANINQPERDNSDKKTMKKKKKRRGKD